MKLMAASKDKKLLAKRKVDKYGYVSYVLDERWREGDAFGHLQKATDAGCVLAVFMGATPYCRPDFGSDIGETDLSRFFLQYYGISHTGADIFERVLSAAERGLTLALHELFRYFGGFGPVHLGKGTLPVLSTQTDSDIKVNERKALGYLVKAAWFPCVCSGVPGKCECDKGPTVFFVIGTREADNTFTWSNGAHQSHDGTWWYHDRKCPVGPRDVSARALALYELGAVHQNGHLGVPRNDDRALERFQMSAERGHPGAQFQVATWLLSRGRSDDAKCMLVQSAEGGSADAMYELSILLDREFESMDPDLVEALRENPGVAFKQDPEKWSVEMVRRYCARQRGLKAIFICGAPRPVGSGGLREVDIFRPSTHFEAALLALPRCQLGILSFTASSLCCTAARLGHPGAMNAYADSFSTGKWFGESGKKYVFEDSPVYDPDKVLY